MSMMLANGVHWWWCCTVINRSDVVFNQEKQFGKSTLKAIDSTITVPKVTNLFKMQCAS